MSTSLTVIDCLHKYRAFEKYVAVKKVKLM